MAELLFSNDKRRAAEATALALDIRPPLQETAQVTSLGALTAQLVRPLRPAWTGEYSSSRRPNWGEGLVEQSMTTLYYRAHWSDVSDDELVLLLPSLVGVRDTCRQMRLTALLRLALLRCVRELVDALRCRQEASSAGLGRTARILGGAELRVAAGILMDPALAKGAPRRRRYGSKQGALSALAFCMIIERALATVQKNGPDGDDELGQPLSALLLSIAGRFNAAYVIEGRSCEHELLTLGAWIGNLQERDAWLPACLAERVMGVLEAPLGHNDPHIALLRDVVQQACAPSQIMRAARKAMSSGSAQLCRSRAPAGFLMAPASVRQIDENGNLADLLACHAPELAD